MTYQCPEKTKLQIGKRNKRKHKVISKYVVTTAGMMQSFILYIMIYM